MKINEGDAVIVEPNGAIGIVSAIYPFDKFNIELDKFHIKTIVEWQYYWLTTHKFNLEDFKRVMKVIFMGNEYTYDYPETAIRKVIHFKKFNKIQRWNVLYHCDYIPLWKIFKRIRIYLLRIKKNRENKKYYNEAYGI